MILKDKKLIRSDHKIEKVRLELEIDLRELEPITSPKVELQITE